MKKVLNKLGYWLWIKTHEITATEIAIMKESNNYISSRKCVNCGKSPFFKAQ